MNDDWGQDPSVRFMRRVFRAMEETQKTMLSNVNISYGDVRLRRWRETARALFEQAWPVAGRGGVVASEEEAGILYAHCFARALIEAGIKIPQEILPPHEKISKLLKEVRP
jgi:predicted trehalose synthase